MSDAMDGQAPVGLCDGARPRRPARPADARKAIVCGLAPIRRQAQRPTRLRAHADPARSCRRGHGTA